MAHGELPPLNITPGAIRFNTDSMKLEYFRIGTEGTTNSASGIGTMAAGEWVQVTTNSPEIMTNGTRGLIASGNTNSGKIEMANLASTGNIAVFGDIGGTGGAYRVGTADKTRAVFFNAQNATDSQFVTIASHGNATSESHTTMPTDYNQAASASDGVRGFRVGGTDAGVSYNTIYQIIFQTTGISLDFGDLSVARHASHGNMSPTRAVFAGGANPSNANGVTTIDYIQMATQGIAANFGDLKEAGKYRMSGCNAVRGLVAGGSINNSAQRAIEYVTMATLGEVVDFGNLGGDANTGSNGACSSPTRALFVGVGNNDTTNYVEIMSTGTAEQFGDLTLGRNYAGTTSNGHGGLG